MASTRFFRTCQSRDGLRPTRWAVQNLLSLGCPQGDATRIFLRAVPSNKLHLRVSCQPVSDSFHFAAWEEINGLTGKEIHNDRAIREAAPEGKVIHAYCFWYKTWRDFQSV
ncbi:hypothetical protein Deipe_4280 (plasmid) [Deinococcus peraridilitoris DSM 19664]|uniref:Uncharacterized protein n=1 Tax=Deinococcus peraridilitoris (strain DSM 19664 / LMG 22246 / CIP 109416 / KR-200) TaxID=937777 RepID=L0A6Z4_DEIPD|nr:hypothetical protein Deipe_4280 [Deinococcus peraridilitoris DSM 19664]